MGYLKMTIYSPFWMVNKTGLTLEYKVTNSFNKIIDSVVDACIGTKRLH